MQIKIEIPEEQYSRLFEISKITKIKPQKIIEIFLEENFFNQSLENNKQKNQKTIKNEDFLQDFKEIFKGLEINQHDLSQFFRTSIPTISRALSGKQENFVYRKFKKAYQDNSVDDFVKNIYLSTLLKYVPIIENSKLISLSKKNNILKYFLGFVNKNLNENFNEEYFLKKSNLEELLKELEKIDINNLSSAGIFNKFEYLYHHVA